MSAHARDLMLIAVGGAVGAMLRHTVGRLVGPQIGPTIPWHTFAINISGAFAIGLLIVLSARFGFPAWWRPLIAVGILGGYTTFSTFSLEVVDLALQGRPMLAGSYALGSVFAGVAGCALGIFVGRSV